MASHMYDAENVEFKLSRLRRHLKVSSLKVQPSLRLLLKSYFVILIIKSPSKVLVSLRSLVRTEVRPTENDSTQLYKNDDISVVITCS